MISLEKICRSFTVGDEKVHALKDVDLRVTDGEYISIMGPSGSGKSTLLNMIGLLDRPDSGSYRIGDDDVTLLSDRRQAEVRCHKIGFIFQFFHLVSRMTARENIELPMILAGIEPKIRRSKVQEAVEAFGLADRASHRPDQLSGGQRQRVAIARATVMQPEILLADEPTGNLDSASGMDVINILERLNADGITLIMVTHDPSLGRRAERQLTMVDGRIEHDSVTSLSAAPAP